MAITADQIQQEQTTETQLNQLSASVIGMTAWGQFYSLMRGAAAAGEGAIPHEVCLSKDGRNVTVYKGTAGKLVGSFLKPTHEVWTKYLAQKDWKKLGLTIFGAASGLPGIAQTLTYQEQLKATCYTVVPNTVIQYENTRVTNEQAKQTAAPAPVTETSNTNIWLIGTFIILVLILLTILIIQVIKRRNGN